MDPTPVELAAISTVPDAVAWIGMQQPMLEGLSEAMGGLDLLREIVLIPFTAWDEAVAAVRVTVPGVGETRHPLQAAEAVGRGGFMSKLQATAQVLMGRAVTAALGAGG